MDVRDSHPKTQDPEGKPELSPYEPPVAIWIPLAIEERLLSCGKLPGWASDPFYRCVGDGMQHLNPNQS